MKGKVPIGGVMLMWTFTIFLAMFYWYSPAYYGDIRQLFLFLALLCSAVTFRVTIKRK